MTNTTWDYNSGRVIIKYPEYGRSIQELIEFACSIENDQKRQKTVEGIVAMMQMLAPNNRGIEDYKERLWNHAFAISDYKLNVQPPQGITITRQEEKKPPVPMPYPQQTQRFRHYGAGIQKLVAKAIDMPDGVKKEGLVEVIGSYMKLAYKTWNREHYVSDDIVKEDLVAISHGKLELHDGYSSLDTLSFYALKAEKEQNKNNAKKGNNKKKQGGNSSNNQRSRSNNNSRSKKR